MKMTKENFFWGKDLPGTLMEKWPKDQNNEYVEAAFLKTCTQWAMEDEILRGMLEDAGIPSFKKFPHYGGFGNLIIGQSAEGVDIYVPKTRLEEAIELINQEIEESAI